MCPTLIVSELLPIQLSWVVAIRDYYQLDSTLLYRPLLPITEVGAPSCGSQPLRPQPPLNARRTYVDGSSFLNQEMCHR